MHIREVATYLYKNTLIFEKKDKIMTQPTTINTFL